MKDYFGYKDKVAVVTGAASGMGKATTEMLVDLGAKVYALDWQEVKVDGITQYIHVDLSQKESIDQAFENLPDHIHSFFGIAGVSGSKNDFITTCKIDLLANKYICEEFLTKRMQKGDSIAFITSTGGNGWERDDNKDVFLPVLQVEGWEESLQALEQTGMTQMPGTMGYPFSKLAMNYYTVQLQQTFASQGIRVNAVLPGSTDTGMKDEFTQMAGGEEGLLAHCGYAGRLATSEEMAMPVVFLNSDMASYISGEHLIVDYAQTSEEVAGLKTVEQVISLKGILEYMKNMQK